MAMEPRRAPEYTLEVFADPTSIKDVVKAILHTIFFHRYFMTLKPLSRELFDTTLPAVDDVELEALVEQRVTSLIRNMQQQSTSGLNAMGAFQTTAGASTATSAVTGSGGGGGGGRGGKWPAAVAGDHSGRGQLSVTFYERKRRKTYFFGKADEDVCWETWLLNVTCATPRTDTEKVKVRRAMESSLQKAAFKIIGIVNRDRDHIPPITTTDTNPFPYQIVVGSGAALSAAAVGAVGAAGGGAAGGSGSPRIGMY